MHLNIESYNTLLDLIGMCCEDDFDDDNLLYENKLLHNYCEHRNDFVLTASGIRKYTEKSLGLID